VLQSSLQHSLYITNIRLINNSINQKMKKLFFALIALLCSVTSINATDLYLRGSINEWSTKDEYKFATDDNDTYTLSVSSLSGEFKLASSDWTTYNYGKTDNKTVDLNVPYTCKEGSDSNLSLTDNSASNVTLTFVMSTKTLTITGQKAENTYEQLYLIGAFGDSWSESRTDYPLEAVADATVPTFSGKYTISATSYFKVLAGTWQYGPGELASSDLSVTDGFDSDIYYPAGSKSYKIPAGTYTFTVTMENGSKTAHMTVTSDGEEGGNTEVGPETLYIIGQVEGNNWNCGAGYQLTKENGIFSASNVAFNDGDTNSYFSFIVTPTGSWNTLTRYGAENKDTQVTPGEAITFQSGENAFYVANGKYDISVDFNTMKVTLTAVEENGGEGNGGDVDEHMTVYLVGQINDSSWNEARTDYPLTAVEDAENTYTTTVEVTSSSYFYVLAGSQIYTPGGWAQENLSVNNGYDGDIYGESCNFSYEITEQGTYIFTVVVEKGVTPAHMTVVKQKAAPVYPETIYIVGDYLVDGEEVHWNPAQGLAMENIGDGVYVLDGIRMTYGAQAAPSAYFSFCTQRDSEWANVGTRYGASQADEAIAVGDEKTVVVADQPNSFAINPGVNTAYKVTFNLAEMTVSVDLATGVAGIAAEENATVNVYNLQGVQLRKGVNAANATENLPAGIYVVGGKKVVVK
jgi:hypothetical protein